MQNCYFWPSYTKKEDAHNDVSKTCLDLWTVYRLKLDWKHTLVLRVLREFSFVNIYFCYATRGRTFPSISSSVSTLSHLKTRKYGKSPYLTRSNPSLEEYWLMCTCVCVVFVPLSESVFLMCMCMCLAPGLNGEVGQLFQNVWCESVFSVLCQSAWIISINRGALLIYQLGYINSWKHTYSRFLFEMWRKIFALDTQDSNWRLEEMVRTCMFALCIIIWFPLLCFVSVCSTTFVSINKIHFKL